MIEDVQNQSEDTLNKWIEAFETDKYSALFHLGFLKKEKLFSPPIEFLHHIAEMLIKKLSQQSEIKFSRDTVQVDLLEEELYKIKEELPKQTFN